jgi:hypothetical protein
MTEIILILGLLGLATLNVYASFHCYRDTFSERGQRWAQIVFIWVVPVVGAVLALRLSRNEPEQSTGSYRSDQNLADEYVTGFGRQNSHGYISSPDDNFHSTGSADVPTD